MVVNISIIMITTSPTSWSWNCTRVDHQKHKNNINDSTMAGLSSQRQNIMAGVFQIWGRKHKNLWWMFQIWGRRAATANLPALPHLRPLHQVTDQNQNKYCDKKIKIGIKIKMVKIIIHWRLGCFSGVSPSPRLPTTLTLSPSGFCWTFSLFSPFPTREPFQFPVEFYNFNICAGLATTWWRRSTTQGREATLVSIPTQYSQYSHPVVVESHFGQYSQYSYPAPIICPVVVRSHFGQCSLTIPIICQN